MVAPGFELKSVQLWSPYLAVTHAPRSACFREDPDSGRRVLAFKVPAEDTRCSAYHTVGIKPPGTISAQLQSRGLKLLGETRLEPVSDLTSFLKGDNGFWIHGGGKRVFQGQDEPVQGLEAGMHMAIVQ